MATTKKKTETASVSKENVENTKIIDKEKELLKEKLALQEKEMADLKAQMELLLKSLSNKEEKKEDNITKNNKKTIKFINMTTGGFTIRGTRLYHLDKQFDSISFSENEAKAIVANMPQSIANGFLYIADPDFVEECELDGIYMNLVDEKTLKNLLKNDSSEVCRIYKNASDEQKKIIVDMIVDKKINNVPIDANILVELGKLCGKRLIDIEPLDEE